MLIIHFPYHSQTVQFTDNCKFQLNRRSVYLSLALIAFFYLLFHFWQQLIGAEIDQIQFWSFGSEFIFFVNFCSSIWVIFFSFTIAAFIRTTLWVFESGRWHLWCLNWQHGWVCSGPATKKPRWFFRSFRCGLKLGSAISHCTCKSLRTWKHRKWNIV